MFRCALPALLAAVGLGTLARAEDPQEGEPPRFDISINGENFVVEGGRFTRLKSKVHPGTEYHVAVQLAQLQHWRMNTLEFDYQNSFEVADDGKASGRTATLRHSLGFVAAITDLGGSLPAKSTAEALTMIVDSVRKTLEATGAQELKVGKPKRQKLGANVVDAVTMRYTGDDRIERGATAYLVTSAKFACSMLVQYRGEDREEALDQIRSILESLAPRELAAGGAKK